jgi:hypothetical protein
MEWLGHWLDLLLPGLTMGFIGNSLGCLFAGLATLPGHFLVWP